MLIVWILIGVALLGVELHHLAFFALFGSVGAFAAAVVAAVAPAAVAAISPPSRPGPRVSAGWRPRAMS
jgi:hypothetical protein